MPTGARPPPQPPPTHARTPHAPHTAPTCMRAHGLTSSRTHPPTGDTAPGLPRQLASPPARTQCCANPPSPTPTLVAAKWYPPHALHTSDAPTIAPGSVYRPFPALPATKNPTLAATRGRYGDTTGGEGCMVTLRGVSSGAYHRMLPFQDIAHSGDSHHTALTRTPALTATDWDPRTPHTSDAPTIAPDSVYRLFPALPATKNTTLAAIRGRYGDATGGMGFAGTYTPPTLMYASDILANVLAHALPATKNSTLAASMCTGTGGGLTGAWWVMGRRGRVVGARVWRLGGRRGWAAGRRRCGVGGALAVESESRGVPSA